MVLAVLERAENQLKTVDKSGGVGRAQWARNMSGVRNEKRTGKGLGEPQLTFVSAVLCNPEGESR